MMFCPNCNLQIPDGSQICPSCGFFVGLGAAMPDMNMGAAMPDMNMGAAMPQMPDMSMGAAMPQMPDMAGLDAAAMPQPELPSDSYSTDFYSQPAASFAPTAEQTAQLPVFPAQPYGAMASATPAVRIIQSVTDETQKPLTFWQCMGFIILLFIPVVGFIATVIFACSKGINRNLRNLSRAALTLCLVPLLIALIVLLTIVLVTGGLALPQ